MKYNGFEVDNVVCGGDFVNVNGTTITRAKDSYYVFVEGDEICFETFEQAYKCATTEQKDTFWL